MLVRERAVVSCAPAGAARAITARVTGIRSLMGSSPLLVSIPLSVHDTFRDGDTVQSLQYPQHNVVIPLEDPAHRIRQCGCEVIRDVVVGAADLTPRSTESPCRLNVHQGVSPITNDSIRLIARSAAARS